MISLIDIKAYAVKSFFNLWGRLGTPLINIGATKGLDVVRDQPYGPEPEQRLDIFKPQNTHSGGLPILIYFHGGGWISADKKFYDGICATLSKNGFLTFNVNYRLAPAARFPAQLRDAARAIDWVDRNAIHYGGDRSTIILAGDSAGAQIAAWYASALHDDSLFPAIEIQNLIPKVTVKGLLLFYGVYDFDTSIGAPFPFIKTYVRSFLGTEKVSYAQNSALASPIRHVSNALPPIFLCAGERDGLFQESVAYANALEECDADYQKLFFSRASRADHGFLFFRWLRSSKEAYAASGAFLKQLVKGR